MGGYNDADNLTETDGNALPLTCKDCRIGTSVLCGFHLIIKATEPLRSVLGSRTCNFTTNN